MAHKYNMDPHGSGWDNLVKAQNGTVDELVAMLDSHSIALMIRPTGFGKTHLMIELAKRENYEKVLYLYPMDVIKQSIEVSYHKCDETGKPIHPSNKDGIKYAENEEEHKLYPTLPYIEFCTYAKLLEDVNNVYRFFGTKEWSKMSSSEKEKLENKWNKLSSDEQEKLKQKWIKQRFEQIELLVLDEAHMCGAAGFMSYWNYIYKLTKGLKANRLHILGATATPLRTAGDRDIEKDIFNYEYGNKVKSARISEFTMETCWKYNILKRPYYIRGILDKQEEKENILKMMLEYNESDKQGKRSNKESISESEEKLDEILDSIMDVANVIYTGVNEVDSQGVSNKSYIRLLVFHPDSASLIANHTKINDDISGAFINNEVGYKKLNAYYIASNIVELKSSGIEVSNVSVINDRDFEIETSASFGDYEVDVIHSIDMLNMGYHVGKVTGIIARRKTSSEIIYYQQIGRCVSVSANNQPLIIDLANAAAELYSRTSDKQREEAVNKIKDFITGCKHCKGQNREVDNFYKYMNMCLDMEPLDKSILEFWYFNRKAPIYYIMGISRALGKKDTLETIMASLIEIGHTKRKETVIDTDFCNGMIEKNRIDKKVIQRFITPQPEILTKLTKTRKEN